MKPQKHILTYLKLPEYMIPLVYARYGNPVSFSEGSRLQKLFEHSLVLADEAHSKSRISCCKKAFDIAKAKQNGQIRKSDFEWTPSGDEVHQFVPVVMPLCILVKDEETGMYISEPATEYHAINLSSAQKIRKLIRQVFWSDLNVHNKEFASSDTQKDNTLKFLGINNISSDMFETVLRTATRLSADM